MQGGGVCPGGLVHIGERQFDAAEAGPGLDEFRLQLQGGAVVAFGLLEVATSHEELGQIVVRLRRRMNLDGAPEKGLCLIGKPQLVLA